MKVTDKAILAQASAATVIYMAAGARKDWHSVQSLWFAARFGRPKQHLEPNGKLAKFVNLALVKCHTGRNVSFREVTRMQKLIESVGLVSKRPSN